jgi:hypothetical protein
MHSTGLRALSALALGLGLSLGSGVSFAQTFEGEDAGFAAPQGAMPASCRPIRSSCACSTTAAC